MRPSSSPPGGALPAWLALAGSAFLLVHLAAVGLAALDVPSGPWPGVGFVPAPPFVHAAARPTNFTHVRLLKVGHAFRHYTNRPGVPGAVFEVRLKDDKGQPLTDRRGEPLVVIRARDQGTGRDDVVGTDLDQFAAAALDTVQRSL